MQLHFNSQTRSTGTVHTSAKAHITSAAIWQISITKQKNEASLQFLNYQF